MGSHELLLGLLASVLIFLLGLVGVVVFATRLPADYFVGEKPPRPLWGHGHPGLRWIGRIVKNVLGLLTVALGLVLALPGVPGPGLLTILFGVMLLDFPNKRRFERWLLRQPGVHGFVDRVRRRYQCPPLILEDEAAPPTRPPPSS